MSNCLVSACNAVCLTFLPILGMKAKRSLCMSVNAAATWWFSYAGECSGSRQIV